MALRLALLTALLALLVVQAPPVFAGVGAQQPQPSDTPTPFATLPGIVLATPSAVEGTATPTPELESTPEPADGPTETPSPEPESTAAANVEEELEAPASQPEARTEPESYTVKPGDTLYSIARRFGVTVAELQEANGLQGSAIRAGETLTIPVPGQRVTATPSPTPTASVTTTPTPAARATEPLPPTVDTAPGGGQRASGESSDFRGALEGYTASFLSAIEPFMLGAPPFVLVGALIGVINTCLYYLFLARGFKLFLPHLVVGAAAAVLGVVVGKQLPESGPSLGEVDLLAASLATWLVLFIARSLRL